MRYRTLIMGAHGRDFHNDIMYFKNNPNYEIVAFTATQIPGIEKIKVPKEITGKKDIHSYSEEKLEELIKKLKIDYVFLCYSDLSEREVIEKATRVLASGANFALLGWKDTMIKSKRKLISVCASRTGAGKGTTCRAVLSILKKNVVIIRHPMPYSYNLKKQLVQKFTTPKDFFKYDSTYEEMEEYNPYLEKGFIVYAGIDYKKILKKAEKDAKIIVFESGNNDISFFKPDLYITVVDAKRPEGIYSYPGEVNVELADVIILNKVNIADKKTLKELISNIKKINKKAKIIKARSVVKVENSKLIKNKNVVLVDDAPSVTHGNLKHSVSEYAARKYKAKKIIDPKKYGVGIIKKTFMKYPYLNTVPTMGYSRKQKEEFIKSVNNVKSDSIIFGSYAFIDKIKFNKPVVRVTYEMDEKAKRELEKIINKFIK